MTDERRRAPRQKAFLKGRFNNGLGDVDCLVRELSATGAKVIFSSGITIPDVIDLHIPLKKQVMRSKVEWRNGDEMGVSFIETVQAAPAPAVANDAELSERLAKMEAEIAALRKMLAKLRAEVLPNPDLAEAG